MGKRIENVPASDLRTGDRARLEHEITPGNMRHFTTLAADVNPGGLDRELAADPAFRAAIGQGGLASALIVTAILTRFPGPGTALLKTAFSFGQPLAPGDEVQVEIGVTGVDGRRVRLACACRQVDGSAICEGTAEVIAPEAPVSREFGRPVPLAEAAAPDRFEHIEEMARAGGPVPTAVVFPVDGPSLRGAMESAEAGLITPLLLGPRSRIAEAAEADGVDISTARVVPAETEKEAAEEAARLAAAGQVGGLMKGKLHTDTLLRAVIAHRDLRTGRRMSHVFVMDVPSYPRLLLISDAAVNIAPDLDDLADIVRNAIDLAHVLGIERPKVALLSAVETVDDSIASTVNAAAISKMARQGEIEGADVDGPLAMDNAVSEQAARIKGIRSDVAGAADVLIVPDLVSGNILAKDLDYLAGAEAAGVVMGAKVPIALTSRADSPRERRASAALMRLVAASRGAG